MAGFDAKQRELILRLVLCGPTQAGKSSTLERLREHLGDRAVASPRTLSSQPTVIFGEPTARLLVEVREIDPIEVEADLATCALAAADGVLFVADSRRARLRDDLVAYAWFLERMREAGRGELPGVLLLNRRDASTCLAPEDIEAVLGEGRFPSFQIDATRSPEVTRGVGELLRRAATRVHGELLLGDSGITLSNLLGAVDVATTRDAPKPAPVEPEPKPAAATPVGAQGKRPQSVAPARLPLLRFGQRMLVEQGRLSRERRRLRDHAAWIEEEARRPIAFLKALFLHLEREAPRLSNTLDEAVAGAGDVIGHLEGILNGTRRVAVGDAMRDRAAARSRHCDLPMLARQAFASVERELPDARLALKRGVLPGVDSDPDLLRALFWATFAAVARSNLPRKGRRTIVRLRVKSDGHGLQMKVGRVAKLGRGAGIEEVLLARRLARRLGLKFTLVPRRAGRSDIALELGPAAPPVRVRSPEVHAAIS